ncbi:MAG: FtsX-like permease family protein [Oscillospiraceae bacterium]
MFGKLAFRNVRRQIGNYVIYFITVSLTVALMFAVNNVIFSEHIRKFTDVFASMQTGLIGISIGISLIVSFVLGYATSFMLKLRKREFGTYLTLGMTRKNILSIFILETMILCVVALGIGIVLGLFLYQGMMAIMTKLMEMEFAFASYSPKGLLFTIVLVCGVFLLSSVTSAFYLKRATIYHLIHGEKMVEKGVKHPKLWLIVTLLSFVIVMGSCWGFWRETEKAFLGDSNGQGLLVALGTLSAGLLFFHIGLARSVVNLMLNRKSFCSKGTNVFTLRQLSGKLRTNSVMAGILAFLIAFAIIGANTSFVQKISEQNALNQNYPFDVLAIFDPIEPPPVSLEEGEQIIGNYAEIEQTIPYEMYTTGTGYFHSFTKWTGEGYEGLTDSFIKESDFNHLLVALGREPIQLNETYLIVANFPQIEQYDFSKGVLERNGVRCTFQGMVSDIPLFSYVFFFVVIPDAVAEGMTVETEYVAMDLKDGKFDARALKAELSYAYQYPNRETIDQRCDYTIREYGRMEQNSTSAILVVGALYVAVVFVFMAMAILALKTLAGLEEDKQRYQILFRLGASRKEQNRTLFRQTFSFFFLPFGLPVLLSIPTGIICGKIMELGGFGGTGGTVCLTAGVIALVMVAIYLLYFTATYLIAKRAIVHTCIE